MGKGKAYSARRWAWATGLTLVAALLAATPVASQAVEVGSGDSIMLIYAHPDDDIITAGGIVEAAHAAGNDVKVAFLTNGDRCDSPSQYYEGSYCTTNSIDPGPPLPSEVRQGEAVAAEASLGTPGIPESDLIFLGYPNGFLPNLRYGVAIPYELVHTETYASRGLGSTDWHNYHFGGHGQYTGADMLADVQALINTYRPDQIFTHSRWDRHEDHYTTYLEVVEAISNIQDSDPSYQPIIHTTIVHVEDPAYWGLWPASANPVAPINEYASLGSDTDDELVWDQRESFEVPSTSDKTDAVYAHASQVTADAGFITRFIHSDEIFWPEKLGDPAGTPDSFYVDEGGSLYVSASGVLSNDVRGIGDPPDAPYDPTPLGPMSALLVSGPPHASSFSLNSDGSFSYTHDGSETTTDSFTYRPTQTPSGGGTTTYGSETTVYITINPVNDGGPTAVGDSYSLDNGATLNVSTGNGVLSNDTDPDTDTLTAIKVSNPAHGSLTLNNNGSFTYTHDGSNTTSDSFTYRANDGQYNSNTATVSLTIGKAEPPPPSHDLLDVTINGPITGATGTSHTFTAVVTGGDGTRSYAWTAQHNGSTVSTGKLTSFTFSSATAGDYTIGLTVTDSSGSAGDTHDLKLLGDIVVSPFASDIIWLADSGITQGCNPPTNDQYCPNDRVTRGQMAAFLVRFLGLTNVDPGIAFDDIGGTVFESNILKMATAGITKGCNPPANDEFCPNDNVTRGQMAAFLVRALGLTDIDTSIGFVDTGSSVFETNILKLATAGITRGCNPPANDRFCPNDYVTRGQMAAFLHRADGLVN